MSTPGSDSIFYDDQGEPQFRDSVVLYLDLLGTVAASGEGEQLARLQSTKAAVAGARALANAGPGNDDIRKMTWFSDNLGAFTSIDPPEIAHFALQRMILYVSYLQVEFITRGLIARGALARGSFFADGEFIHGPALIRAVNLEHERARHPRIVLDEACVATAAESVSTEVDFGIDVPLRNQLMVDADGIVFVNFLWPLISDLEANKYWSDFLQTHKGFVEENLKRFDGQERIASKYRWLAGYHNAFIDVHLGHLSSAERRGFEVICSRPLGEFLPFNAINEASSPARP